MNYLGHAFLSFGDPRILTGNMIGDHVKGRLALDNFPPDIKKGLLLHRKIDAFTDTHPAIQRAKVWFRADYGLYSGPILDSLFDHFLATDPKCFASEKALLDFSLETYHKIETQQEYLPASFAAYFPYMKEHNWLYNYRTMQGMQRSLNGLARRAAHIPPIENAYKTFIGHYYQLAQCYYEFIDDVIHYVKVELNTNPLP
ncbi:ACP phosphodiesterase [Chitinophagaceae bacterium MMS25-I14]